MPPKRQRDESLESDPVGKKAKVDKKPVRVWADGCFDMMHWGHANALRQAKACGDILIVGVHSDEEIKRHKGPPVMNERERYLAVSACKWVDEIVEDAPYVTHLETLDKNEIDFCVHGEDISVDEFGRDSYAEVKEAGRFKVIKRSEGVSTTELVGRMLLHSKLHHSPGLKALDCEAELMASADSKKPATVVSHSLPTTRRITQFSEGSRQPKPTDKVVYIDGSFDLFHNGHIMAIKTAKEMGDYLIVGIHDDGVVNKIKGGNLPIMNLHERVLSVLSCRYVDEVIIGAPWAASAEQLKALNVTYFAAGDCNDYPEDVENPYQAAEDLGILRKFKSEFPDLSGDRILKRIIQNHVEYAERNRKKEAREKTQAAESCAQPKVQEIGNKDQMVDLNLGKE